MNRQISNTTQPPLPEITGDRCAELTQRAATLATNQPDSIYAYSVWKALSELRDFFGDEQGIPTLLSEQINQVLDTPLRRLEQSGGLEQQSPLSEQALSELLKAMAILRNQISKAGASH